MSTTPIPTTAVWSTGHRPAAPVTIGGLKRIRWAVRATLLLGVAASVAANVLHALPHLVSQLIAAWPPIALLLTVELISRVPVHRKLLAAIRLLATTTIAAIAAWVSYWHMVGVATRYGETGVSAYLLPMSVDGLVVVASISLVELSGRLHAAQTLSPSIAPAGAVATTTPADDTPADDPTPSEATTYAQTHQHDPAIGQRPPSRHKPVADHPSSLGSGPDSDDDGPHAKHGHTDGTPQRHRRSAITRKAIIDTYRQDPTMHTTAIAEKVGTSERTVRRYLNGFRAGADTNPPNGNNSTGHSYRDGPP
ncbi:winged helix-turn-helix domain-containing protein [Plantactinospora sp. WMMB334]|uniref:winged helix-turn-helix domain-containing protein n=1 Tax=Plantactinospora sp. WMMB334 TaxID=3404119 RepID=UPI003B92BC43